MINGIKGLLDLENSFFSFFKKIGWVFLLNILFLVTSIPVVTIGASATAMYTVLNKIIEERQFAFFGDYFKAFRDNFWQSTLMWVPTFLVTLVMLVNSRYVFYYMSGGFAYVMRAGTILVAVLFCMIGNTIFPLIARFDLSVKEILSITVQIVFQHMLLALESVAFTLVVLGGSLFIVSIGWLGGLFIILPIASPGLHAFMQSYLYEKMFDDYIEKEETEDSFEEDTI
ncbi:MAG: YesL family protein [Lachnospiraceae bacterium]